MGSARPRLSRPRPRDGASPPLGAWVAGERLLAADLGALAQLDVGVRVALDEAGLFEPLRRAADGAWTQADREREPADASRIRAERVRERPRRLAAKERDRAPQHGAVCAARSPGEPHALPARVLRDDPVLSRQ